jgi:dTDP-4-dehydrorhamnose reductase
LLVHYSTDYVFDGMKNGAYLESDPAHPINVYGKSKLAGEDAVRQAGARHLVLRTSWVYAARGKNFLLTILRLAREKSELSVVADQIGAPTCASVIADATAGLVDAVVRGGDHAALGLYHLTASGETSWHGFAQAILAAAGSSTRVHPIPSSEYRTAAARPKNSLLDNGKLLRDFGLRLPHWQSGLVGCVRKLALSSRGK